MLSFRPALLLVGCVFGYRTPKSHSAPISHPCISDPFAKETVMLLAYVVSFPKLHFPVKPLSQGKSSVQSLASANNQRPSSWWSCESVRFRLLLEAIQWSVLGDLLVCPIHWLGKEEEQFSCTRFSLSTDHPVHCFEQHEMCRGEIRGCDSDACLSGVLRVVEGPAVFPPQFKCWRRW